MKKSIYLLSFILVLVASISTNVIIQSTKILSGNNVKMIENKAIAETETLGWEPHFIRQEGQCAFCNNGLTETYDCRQTYCYCFDGTVFCNEGEWDLEDLGNHQIHEDWPC